ncbi:hypothetical protein [Thiocystis violacea]|uniref:hypothetical protein n=1 Tax=Thiocystis violacea TaxID=13725 RepID=UPI001906D44A|nr:hypothetical protein [Thiocystis violacea]
MAILLTADVPGRRRRFLDGGRGTPEANGLIACEFERIWPGGNHDRLSYSVFYL